MGETHLGSMRRPFRTRREVERYFSGKTIQCLLCGRRFGRLSFHLAAKHGLTSDHYKARFGLPWRRGLSSAESNANSGWNEKRKKEAVKLARKTQCFKFAHPSRRESAPFLGVQALKHLGANVSALASDLSRACGRYFGDGFG